MSDKGETWLNLPRSSDEYINGVNDFVENAMATYAVENEVKCPCSICKSRRWWGRDDVYNHLICNGPYLSVVKWIFDVSKLKRKVNTDFMDCDENTGFGEMEPVDNQKKLLVDGQEKQPIDGQEPPPVHGHDPPLVLSDAAIFIRTRKRNPDREYKLPVQVVKKKIEDVEKLMQGGSIDAANEMVRGGKEHCSSWLVGRFIRKKESKGKSTTATTSGASSLLEQYVADLTARIRDQLTQEMEEKLNQKVQENVKLELTKLVKKNPELKVDISDLSVQPSTDCSLGDNNITP